VKSWTRPLIPRLPGAGPLPHLHDTATNSLQTASPAPGEAASLYVCGITPYDATHIGHAATYLAFDTLVRLWIDAGLDVNYAQNTTDVDDPLLERANDRGLDWRALADNQTDLYRGDMESLGVIPPDHFIAVTEVIDPMADAVATLLERGIGYRLEGDPFADVYFDSAAASRFSDWRLGDESRLDEATMLEFSALRGGDPDRPGKRDPLDPLLWRGARPGEPRWSTVVGTGRPGWHIECSVIAARHLALPATVNGGGIDLVFPHHEFSAGHTAALTGEHLAGIYAHTCLVSYQGEKMSKSLGNLVFVSELVAAGRDPRAVRLAILGQHHRVPWEWTEDLLTEAEERLARWTGWAAGAPAGLARDNALDELRRILSNDLDTAGALELIDARISDGTAADEVSVAAIDALLGVRLVGLD